MKNKSLIIIIGVGLVMVGGLVFNLFTADKKATDDNCFTFNEDTKTITDYSVICDKDVVIPNTINNVSVEFIGANAFSNKKLTSVVLPSDLKEVGISAFNFNDLVKVKFNNSLKTIKAYAFADNQIEKISIPETVNKIGYSAFSKNALKGDAAFIYDRNEDGSINDSIIIGYGGLEKDVEIPEGVVSIFVNAFSENELTSIKLSSTVERIAANAFSNNNLKEVVITSNVNHIENDVFIDNPLIKINIEGKEDLSQFIYLGENWFGSCDNIVFSK